MTPILSSASTSSALTVVIPPTIHCGGGCVEGQVLLNFRQLHEENLDEVCVQLSGTIHTCVLSFSSTPPLSSQKAGLLVVRRIRKNKQLYEEKHQILSSVCSVWTRGSAYL